MGYRIVDQLSTGSAMSAYGTARGFPWKVILLALTAGSLLLLAGVFLLRFSRIPLPAHTVFLAVIWPSSSLAGMRQALPEPWATAAHRSGFPVLFGVALDENRMPQPYTIRFRTPFARKRPTLAHTSQGLYLLTYERDDDHLYTQLPTEKMRLQNLPLSLSSLFGNDAVFFIRTDLLEAWIRNASLQTDAASFVSGTWKGSFGRLDIPSNNTANPLLTDGQLLAVTNGATEAREVLFAGLLAQGIDLRGGTLTPAYTAFSLSPSGTRAFILSWSDPLSDPDRTLIISAGGELNAEGTEATFREATPHTSPLPVERSSSDCPGTPHFFLADATLHSVLAHLGVPTAWQTELQRIQLNVSGEETLLCVRLS